MTRSVKEPICFPDHMEEIRQRSQAFACLSPDARLRELAALMELGWSMVRSSPQREAIEKRLLEQEADWQRIQQELFQRYGG